jgi:hypothetical protein
MENIGAERSEARKSFIINKLQGKFEDWRLRTTLNGELYFEKKFKL